MDLTRLLTVRLIGGGAGCCSLHLNLATSTSAMAVTLTVPASPGSLLSRRTLPACCGLSTWSLLAISSIGSLLYLVSSMGWCCTFQSSVKAAHKFSVNHTFRFRGSDWACKLAWQNPRGSQCSLKQSRPLMIVLESLMISLSLSLTCAHTNMHMHKHTHTHTHTHMTDELISIVKHTVKFERIWVKSNVYVWRTGQKYACQTPPAQCIRSACLSLKITTGNQLLQSFYF